MSADLATVRRPLAQANGLPNDHYIDPATFRAEAKACLLDTWAGFATAAEVPEIGDALPRDFAGMPLFMVRDRDGAVRVFQNTCRHRGMILIEEPRKIEGAIRCPYHSWCYSTKGELVSTPHVGGPGMNIHPDLDRSTLGLTEVRAHVWRDVVWINVSGDAPPFEEAMAGVIERWSAFDGLPMVHGGADSTFVLEVNCNWKLAVENYCEAYHLPWVHPGLNSYSRLEDHYNIEEPGQYSGQGSLVYRQLKGDNGAVFPDLGSLPDFWQTGAEYIAVYPNVLLGAHRDHSYAILLLPDGPEKTAEHVHIYYANGETDADLRAKNTAQWHEIFVEDIGVVEGMQRGRHGVLFDGGRFSPAMDGPTHCFHDWVAARMGAGRELAAE